ncbi:sulfotransferase domain-containing protein [Microbulbifer halophilus]|uniref:Sulfotransferase domain-containing protein n=1 Tax=Microbulbifer halophilus TaxID=453963 RepID=A0ABW5EGJ6_9GAMM|nr:sulfotransferase domain-containing protein [Microbulbifer halophilus]MCW8128200.1 sulfotransferase domain-containing protein [Microbulbifer halophilus]
MSFHLAVVLLVAVALSLVILFHFAVLLPRMAAQALPAQSIARKHLRQLRVSKMDKDVVAIVSLQKSGSTLLCYVCALVNTRNAITHFRNDFDLVPMLSFPQSMIAQNFNARQDGHCQLYKINGRVRSLRTDIAEAGIGRTIWMCRDFGGYYRSVYWWVTRFYPRVKPLPLLPLRIAYFLRFVGWNLFKKLTFRLLARDHVEELWCAYKLARSTPRWQFLALSYEHLTAEKGETLRRLAEWFSIDLDDELIVAIAEKTSKRAMAEGDRFDPVNFGDGGGQTKINLAPHGYQLDGRDMALYQKIFTRRFAGTGIRNYADYIEVMRRLQSVAPDEENPAGATIAAS